MATKIQQIIGAVPHDSVLFGSWLSSQGLDARGQYSYMKSGWLDRISKGVYKIHGSTPTLMATVSSYNMQLGKSCIVGAYTALEFRGYSHYLSMGKPLAYLFTDKTNKLPSWLLKEEWDMTIKYMTTSFLGNELLGVETMTNNQHELLVSSPERAILECLNLPDASYSLLDIYYIMESMTTLRPKLVQTLLESCTSQKVKRLFLYMAEKAGHSWFMALKPDNINLGTSRFMVTPTGKFINKYNMTISKELAEYE
ncbi:type IV toxin-antitoxin system AbiEi family antitoxin domain-containing protein [Prevotella koreensis]|uniref:type IV toxin-antitoxin system AbiEi family antitoxin domain-containing protein n=1 Tax=Prevotella koreensis TaxID=2490854 RepID=UPI0028E4C38E|nr:type IV toxin-antitoxin system AbiEi family antitoxin domain-containing protein [Prevotella koreensis]